MKYISLLLDFLSTALFSATDRGTIVVDGETVEVLVERVYSPQATYPRSALRRGVEGFVVVEFAVSPEGEVIDPYVVETDSPGSFERTAMRTIRRWAYKPPVYNGVAITVDDVKARFTFRLSTD